MIVCIVKAGQDRPEKTAPSNAVKGDGSPVSNEKRQENESRCGYFRLLFDGGILGLTRFSTDACLLMPWRWQAPSESGSVPKRLHWPNAPTALSPVATISATPRSSRGLDRRSCLSTQRAATQQRVSVLQQRDCGNYPRGGLHMCAASTVPLLASLYALKVVRKEA